MINKIAQTIFLFVTITSLSAPMRGSTVESFLMRPTKSFEMGELKKTNALHKNKRQVEKPIGRLDFYMEKKYIS